MLASERRRILALRAIVRRDRNHRHNVSRLNQSSSTNSPGATATLRCPGQEPRQDRQKRRPRRALSLLSGLGNGERTLPRAWRRVDRTEDPGGQGARRRRDGRGAAQVGCAAAGRGQKISGWTQTGEKWITEPMRERARAEAHRLRAGRFTLDRPLDARPAQEREGRPRGGGESQGDARRP